MHVTVSPESQAIQPHQSLKPNNTDLLKQGLIALIESWPYESINLEQDTQFSDLIDQIQDLELDPSQNLISKAELLAKLQPSLQPAPFLNPAKAVLSYFDLVAGVQENKKLEQFSTLQTINQDLELLSKILGEFQSASTTDRVDLSKKADIQQLIDTASKKFGFPSQSQPYVWEDKNQVIAFLNQKTKEQMHRSSEAMLHFQHQTDLMKTMRDTTQEMLEGHEALIRTILQHSGGR